MSPPRNQHGFTLIELLGLIAAIILARWMADKFSRHFDSPWNSIVFWTTAIVGTLIFFLAPSFTVGGLVHWKDRRKTKTSPDESHTDR
jgi:hypothetical protein